MPGLTAKVFRTYNASYTLQQELNKAKEELQEDEVLENKMTFYDEANKSVAILCNHQKTVSKAYEASKEKALQKIEDIEEANDDKERASGRRHVPRLFVEVDLVVPDFLLFWKCYD